MMFSPKFETFNLENRSEQFLWKIAISHKPTVFHTTFNWIPMICLRFEFLAIENPSVNPYGKFMVFTKPHGFTQIHTWYQWSDVRFEFPDIENPSVNIMENTWFPPKPMVFHRSIHDTNQLTSDSSSSTLLTYSKVLKPYSLVCSIKFSKAEIWLVWERHTDKHYEFLERIFAI
jgi:hypothetical protein